ncbi:MAG: 4-diphosphocytidyl-2-C-methyl-D-erythritol kinase [Thermodesulfobacteriota bacterium]|nr:MAG: 4-diphosphocytidyl-2-C-methyl-D-erythritol kinase [Thermodesulfobacteriota bacterium]
MRSTTLLSPAKVNLTLEILGIRPDRYHEIRSIIQPIDLFDEVSIGVEEGEGIDLESSGITIPLGKDNLAWRAAELFLEKSELKLRINIFIKKQIPLGTGLGGGSSNAAAVLIGLNKITGALLEDDLFKIAPTIGADVPFFIRSQTATIEGVGEIINGLRDFPTFHYVILCPNIHTSTEEVYKKWDELHNSEPNQLHSSQNNLKDIIPKFMDNKLATPLKNDLEEAAFALHPEIRAFKEILTSLDLKSVLMTGSGSAVFALFRTKEHASEIFEYLKTSPTFKVFLASGIKGWHRLI